MIPVETFKLRLIENDPEDLLTDVLSSDWAVHVSPESRYRISNAICSTYGIRESDVNACIVGSAKLGFSISEKKKGDGTLLPRFRPFGPNSDIDVAVISPVLFKTLWIELSNYAHQRSYMPWDSKELGKYIVYGWLRPDHFPKASTLRYCNSWWKVFGSLSQENALGRRKVRGGLYYSMEHLRQYQMRGLMACRQSLED